MRSASFVVLLSSLICQPMAPAFASDQPQRANSGSPGAAMVAANERPGPEDARLGLRTWQPSRRTDGRALESEACLSMHMYYLKRERRGSGLVRPAGEDTCVPSSRFAVRSAEGQQGDRP